MLIAAISDPFLDQLQSMVWTRVVPGSILAMIVGLVLRSLVEWVAITLAPRWLTVGRSPKAATIPCHLGRPHRPKGETWGMRRTAYAGLSGLILAARAGVGLILTLPYSGLDHVRLGPLGGARRAFFVLPPNKRERSPREKQVRGRLNPAGKSI